MLVVYVHLIACCVAIGIILVNDLGILVRLYEGRIDKRTANLDFLKTTVSVMLGILWISGLLLVAHEATDKGWAFTLSNPKLQAKILVVSLLTLNGVILHYSVLPMMSKARSLLKLAARQRTWAILAGAFSGVSWMYAAFLGIARPLAWKIPLTDLLVVYPVLIGAAFGGMWAFTNWVLVRANSTSDELFMNSVIASPKSMKTSR